MNRIRKPLLLDKSETLKHPSVSLIPKNHESCSVGRTVDRIGRIWGNHNEPLDAQRLNADRKVRNLACRMGNTRLPFNS